MAKSYRIGIDARLYNQTGVGRYIRNLIKHLAKLDRINHFVLFIRKSDAASFQIPSEKFSLKIADIQWHSLAEQIYFPLLLYKENLDLMHFPYFSVPVFYKRPFIVTIHDLTPFHFATGQASLLPKVIYQIKQYGYTIVLTTALKYADAIITPSYATKNAIDKTFSELINKITVTYEGVDKVRSNQAKPLISEKYFLYVGNAYPHKNLDRLIKAFFKLSVPAKLVFVGAEDYFYYRLKNKITTHPKANDVIFFGHANDQELSNLYTHALALVFPSLTEGFGLPALEAMAYGCIVIVSKIPALVEVCGSVPLYINPLNEESIRGALMRVYKDKNKLRDHVSKGVTLSKNFSWNTMALQTKSVYERCLSLRSSK